MGFPAASAERQETEIDTNTMSTRYPVEKNKNRIMYAAVLFAARCAYRDPLPKLRKLVIVFVRNFIRYFIYVLKRMEHLVPDCPLF